MVGRGGAWLVVVVVVAVAVAVAVAVVVPNILNPTSPNS